MCIFGWLFSICFFSKNKPKPQLKRRLSGNRRPILITTDPRESKERENVYILTRVHQLNSVSETPSRVPPKLYSAVLRYITSRP